MFLNRTEIDFLQRSLQFRRTLEERIERLERDADHDEAQISLLQDADHIRRQMKLVAVERSEVRRLRLFLDSSQARLSHPPHAR